MSVPGFRTPALAASGVQVCCIASLCASILCLSQPPTAFGNPQLGNNYEFQQNAAPPRVLSRLQPAQLTGQDSARQPSDYSIQFPNTYNSQRDLTPSQPTSGALAFAWSMLQRHVLPQQTNSAICPILPQTLLASLYDAADDEAKSELRSALQASSQELQPILQRQLLATNRSGSNQLDYAMAYFLGADTKINEDIYRRAIQDGVSFQKVDFRNQNEAANSANRWVTGKTRGIIREIIAPGTLDPATRLMMASVIYFKGKWKFQFTKTEPAPFETGPPSAGRQATQQVPMMYQYNKFRYGETDFQSGNGVRWIELPYEGSSGLSMVLVLPKVRHQLQRSLEEFSQKDMSSIMEQLTLPRTTNKVHLYVPRFSVFSSSSLVTALKSLGLRGIFEREAALAGLSNQQLVVRDVAQRTYIAVDEQGTTATSVASLSFVALSAAPPPPTINFTVNEPFLAMIVDKMHAYPMFVAKVVTPEQF